MQASTLTGPLVTRALVALMQGLTERDWLVYRVNSADKFRMYISHRAANALIDIGMADLDSGKLSNREYGDLFSDRGLQHMQTCLLNQLVMKMQEVRE